MSRFWTRAVPDAARRAESEITRDQEVSFARVIMEGEPQPFEQGIHDSARLLEALFDAIADAIGVKDKHRRIIRYNAAGYRFPRLSPQEVHGRCCYELTGRAKPCEVCATVECVRTESPSQVEKSLPELGIWLECRSYPVLDDAGEILYVRMA